LLQNNFFLVSGGSGGIGAAVCKALSKRGYTPIIGYNKNKIGAETLAKETGGVSIALDLSSLESIDNACRYLLEKNINLVGIVLAGSPAPNLLPFCKIESSDLINQLQVNVIGPQILLSFIVKTFFRKTKKGQVLGILSKAMGGGIGSASSGMSSYIIAKYAMEGMLSSLASDYPWLHVSTVSPGYTNTSMLNAFDERFLEIQRSKVKFSSPNEIAELIMAEVI
jgi:3-oxoacyl-[acyl-carrier protein] reductase